MVQHPSRHTLWLSLAVIIFLGSACAASSTTTTTSGPTQVTVTKQAALPTPKPTPVPKPSPTQGAVGHAILGGNIAAFIAKYGPPDTGCATCQSGVYNFKRFPGTQIDYLTDVLVDADAVHKGHVNSLLVQAPPQSTWDAQTATTLCESFGPTDVNYDHPLQVIPSPDGTSIEKVYKSAWLASQLIASDFVDRYGNTNPVPGTFDIVYGNGSSSATIDQCSLDTGIDQP
jgi:hypothetical protein